MQEYFWDKKRIYYRTNNFQKNRLTLVFVHGISGSSSAWRLYEEKFSSHYNILTWDLRGHGYSSKPKNFSDYSISHFADDLRGLLKFLHIKKCILISHSFGVLVVLDFLQDNMDIVQKLIFLSPNFAPSKILSAKIFKPFLSLAVFLKILPFRQKGRGQVNYERFKNTGDWNILRMRADIGMTSWRVYLYGTKQSYAVNYEKVIDDIKAPTLIIHGQRDTIFPIKGAIAIHDKIKNSQLIILKNSNHILVLNNFREISEAIGKFINRFSL